MDLWALRSSRRLALSYYPLIKGSTGFALPVPGYESQGYQVDFQASLSLDRLTHETEAPVTEATAVAWDLLLTVGIRLPRFIHVLPQKLVHSTGDHLLRQIVRQTSRRLTHRVQEDFHQQLNLPLPPRRHARF